LRASIAIASAVCLLALACGGAPAPPADAPEESASRGPAPEAGEDPTPSTIPRIEVILWFPSSAADALVGEPGEIFSTTDPGARAKQIVTALLAGPQTVDAMPALPPETTLRQVYVLDDGTAWIDFSSQIRRGLGGGSSDERLAVYSVVDSVAFNVPEIGRVGILVDGNPVETLNGHLDLRRPLLPDRSLLTGPGIVGAPESGEI
jgi:spore germination protein GerM